MAITIRDLDQSRELDCRAMATVRGGMFDPSKIVINPQIGASVSQVFDIQILNGADFSGAAFAFDFAPAAANAVKMPGLPTA